MASKLCIYEDANFSKLYPLTLTRPVFNLRCGMTNLYEKIIRHFSDHDVYFFVRNEMADLCKEIHPGKIVNQFPNQDSFFLNSRFLLTGDLPNNIQENSIFSSGNQIIGAFLKASEIKQLQKDDNGLLDLSSLTELTHQEVKGQWINYPWDLVHQNPQEISRDFNYLNNNHVDGKIYPHVTLLAKDDICIGEAAKVYPGVVINAENGPVYVGENVTIMPNAVIEGPVTIGANSTIKMGAKIYEGTSIGEYCKVGGEVEESIIHGFSNKQHEGFLGHAYLGEWVNLGADTNNSDLKNNYGSVKVNIDGQLIDSGSMFVGVFIGDHTKTGINTMINTGSVIGVMCNIFGAEFTPKYIPSFTWGGINSLDRYEFTKAIESAKRVMNRRNTKLTSAQEEILRSIYDSVS